MYRELTDLANALDDLELYSYANQIEGIAKVALMGPSPSDVQRMKQQSAMSASDAMHLILDLIGLVPAYGEAADLTNAALYLAEGLTDENIFKAAISITSMVSGLGDVAKALKYVGRTVSPTYFKTIANLILDNIDTIQAVFSRLKDTKVSKYLAQYVTSGKLLSQNSDRMFLAVKKWAKNIADAVIKKEVTDQAEGIHQTPLA